jgi:hypothetical protein
MQGNKDVHDESGKGTFSSNGVTPMFAKAIAKDGDAKKNMASLSPAGVSNAGGTDQTMGAQMEESVELDITDYINALFEGQDLSDEFKQRAAVIFEAALNEKISIVEQAILQASEELIAEQTESVASTLTESIDEYLSYAINEWMEENRLQVEQGFRTEIAENFMRGLKDLFENSYVDIPEDKVDIVDELFDEHNELQESMNKLIQENMALNEEVAVAKCLNIFFEETAGLADTEIEKIASLSEGINFDSLDQYRDKIKIIKESYLNGETKPTQSAQSSIMESDQIAPVNLNEDMSSYVQSISKQLKASNPKVK